MQIKYRVLCISLAVVLAVLFLAASCRDPEDEDFARLSSNANVMRYHDDEFGVTCWILKGTRASAGAGGIYCLTDEAIGRGLSDGSD